MKLILTILFLSSTLPIFAQEYGDAVQTESDSKNDIKTFETAKIDAQRGDPQAQGDLGLLYEKGLGTPVDDKQAVYWLTKAAKKGDVNSENNLGFMYFNGHGVAQDYAEAMRWFQKASDQGLASAQSNLGLMYGAGLGVPKDFAKALNFYKKAADQNDLDAQINLGMMYSLGEGAPQDYKTSYFWFYLSLQHSFAGEDEKNEVRDDIQWLEKHMKNEEIDQARLKAIHWRPVTSQAQ
jgi:TPR repeat protein